MEDRYRKISVGESRKERKEKKKEEGMAPGQSLPV
jgi:hypothetical protein